LNGTFHTILNYDDFFLGIFQALKAALGFDFEGKLRSVLELTAQLKVYHRSDQDGKFVIQCRRLL